MIIYIYIYNGLMDWIEGISKPETMLILPFNIWGVQLFSLSLENQSMGTTQDSQDLNL
jgi:hypothetical protein